MGNIVTNVKIDTYVDELFKERYLEVDNTDKDGRGVVASMVQRLRELRKSKLLTVAYDDELKHTVFVLHDSVKIDKRTKYHFGGRLLHYVLTGLD